MRGDLVALDLETTGLDVDTDAIIEIGAVRFRDGKITDEYETLINPGFVIPAETTYITGIHQDALRNAPLLTATLPDVSAFVGNAPVIAHNVAFDIGFMRRFGILKNNLPIDTYELAAILLPRVPRYNLSALAEHFSIDLENAHRALDDARATALLYWRLWEIATSLGQPVLTEIVSGMEGLERGKTGFVWEAGEVFRAASAEAQGRVPGASRMSLEDIFTPSEDSSPPLEAPDSIVPLPVEFVSEVLDEHGSIASHIGIYEVRPQQIDMARAVAEAFNTAKHLLVEAGTGTGKTLAYLIPAVLWATQNRQRVVISTNTINLQDQLVTNDVPLVRSALDVDFSAAVLKGRGNYLCPRRLEAVRRRSPGDLDELRMLAKVLVWLRESQSGDRGEISLRSGEYYYWNRLSAEDEGCTTQRCKSQMAATCPYFKARQRAEAAHIVITNHALLIRDAAAENRVLPEYLYLVVDEAHQLEDAITNGMSFRIDQATLVRRLSALGGLNRGLLGDLLGSMRLHAPEKHVMRLEAFVQDVASTLQAMLAQVRLFFDAAYDYTQDSSNNGKRAIRLDGKHRSHRTFAPVAESWEALRDFFEIVVAAMGQLATAMGKLEKYSIPSFDDYLKATAAAERYLREVLRSLHAIVREPDSSTVYWVSSARIPDYVGLHSAPLHVGPLMEDFIWGTKQSVVLTSATLSTTGNFRYLRDRLYADGAQELALGSPFDYRQSTIVFVPDDIPMPNEVGYQRAVERGLIDLAAALDGRVLALFTSYAQLRETAANIGPRLALGNIVVYDQATGGSREALLDSFKTTEKAVLLGTRSFWEGVDIPGDDLSALVIVRLPFAVPSEPVFAARSSTYNDAFRDYALPDAILRFRQGFGRLIRTQSDRGIVAIFDSRVQHKKYGQHFIDSLPDTTLQYGKLEDLPGVATRWLERTEVQ